MTPKDRTAEFFGFYNLSGKATSWMGNLMFPTVMALTQSARLAVVALLVFFVIGLLLTLKIDVAKGAQQAKEST
jgi:UMF1 family MFS transporter